MSIVIATIWYPSSGFYSNWLATVAVFSAPACFVASLRWIRTTVFGQLLMIIGAPVFFITVLFSGAGMFVLKDGREFGFPIWARAYPNTSDFLATYIALGASYVIARKATRMSIRAVRVTGWIEAVGFATLAAFELFLLSRRMIYVG